MVRSVVLALVVLAAVAATAEAAPAERVTSAQVCAEEWTNLCVPPAGVSSTTDSSCRVSTDGYVVCESDGSKSG